MSDFLMPKLGADMTAGRLVAWHKRPGDAVRKGDVVAEVDTEKGVIDIEIFRDGVLERLLVQPGETVPVGTPLATLREEGEPTAGAASPSRAAVEVTAREAAAPSHPPAAGPRAEVRIDAARLRISPAARRLARELSVDPSTLTGSGRGGAITTEDIEAAAQRRAPSGTPAPPAPTPAQAAAERAARMRQTIAAAMSRSKREIPHYYLATTIDMHATLAWLAKRNAEHPVTERVLYGAPVIKAVALALRQVPELNALWDGDRDVRQDDVHVGVAVSLRQGGLVAPALHHTDRLTIDELMEKLRDLVNRVRAGSLRSSELSDPTITVTSLGENGVEAVFGVIYPPQVALVGVGRIVERPWSVGGQIVSRPVMTVTLAADHRVTDGHRGALLLAAIDRLLQEPEKL